MVTATLRKVGSHYEVELPEEEVRRLGLTEGQVVTVDVRPVERKDGPRLREGLREAFEVELERGREGLEYLAGI